MGGRRGNQLELRQPPEVVAQSVCGAEPRAEPGAMSKLKLCVAVYLCVCVCGHGLACQVRPDTAQAANQPSLAETSPDQPSQAVRAQRPVPAYQTIRPSPGWQPLPSCPSLARAGQANWQVTYAIPPSTDYASVSVSISVSVSAATIRILLFETENETET